MASLPRLIVTFVILDSLMGLGAMLMGMNSIPNDSWRGPFLVVLITATAGYFTVRCENQRIKEQLEESLRDESNQRR